MRKGLSSVLLWCTITVAFAHNSYTGGYSGAPGTRICASACHGGSSGTLTVTGFPTSYQPGQTYRIAIKRNGGSAIVNFNATTRGGSTSSVAGSFAAVMNCVLYAGADGGMYASPHLIDSAVFQWTAPASGTGSVTFYAAAYQGTTSSANGQSKAITITSTEIVTAVNDQRLTPTEMHLGQNYPNPFNPTTRIEFSLTKATTVSLSVFDMLGRSMKVLIEEPKAAGTHSVQFDGLGLTSGIYLYRLSTPEKALSRVMTLIK